MMMHARGRSTAAAAIVVLLWLPGTAFGYETDLHYGLTYWLAGKAGFAERQQHDIARGNERTDTGMLDAKHAVVWQLCIRRDETASELTREFHFRSQEPAPAHPNKRKVASDAPFARSAVDAVIREQGTDARDSIMRLGRALHGLQDSFSHQGEPGALPACPNDWAWGHPGTRHGPYSHDADRTHVFPADCVDAARLTHDKLLEYRRHRNLPLGDATWPQLAAEVEDFCRAATKLEKTRWLSDRNVRQARSVTARISLPDGGMRPSSEPLDLGEAAPVEDERITGMVEKTRHVLTTVPAQTWFQSFCQTWLSTDPADLEATLSPYFDATMDLAEMSDTIDTLLRLRLVDRTALSPAESVRAKAQTAPDAFIKTPHNRWRAPFVRVRLREFPVLVGDTDADGLARPDRHTGGNDAAPPDGKHFTSIMILAHAPNDVVLVRAAQTDSGYRVTSVNVLVFH